MPDTPEPNAPSLREVQTRLQDVAKVLRTSRVVDPEARSALAELLDELSTALKASNAPPVEVAHLAESAAHLAEALHHQHEEGLLIKARDGLAGAVFQAETHAPTAVGLARRLLDVLANIGI